MQTNHNLIAKYLEIIAEQDKINKDLSESNLRLVKRNNELNRQKNQYRENCKEWKIKYDEVRSCLNDTRNAILEQTTRANKAYLAKAIDTYKSNQ